jgi:hypothetical protein
MLIGFHLCGDVVVSAAFDFRAAASKAKWVVIILKFQGTGSIDFEKVSREKDGVVYQENFDQPAAEIKQLH